MTPPCIAVVLFLCTVEGLRRTVVVEVDLYCLYCMLDNRTRMTTKVLTIKLVELALTERLAVLAMQ